METSENCEVTVSFGDDDGKSVSVVVNQQVGNLVESLVEIAAGGGPPGGRNGAAPPKCYDCDGLLVSCQEMAMRKRDKVIIIIATC